MKLVNKFKNWYKQFDLKKHYKKLFIIPAVVILAGIIVTAVFGFNLGFDYTGGSVLDVKVNLTTETYSSYVNKIEGVLANNGVNARYVQLREEYDDTSILVRFENKKAATTQEIETLMTEIKNDLVAELNIQLTDMNDYQITSVSTKGMIITGTLSFVIIGLVLLIYATIRYELLNGVILFANLLFNTILSLALVAVLRVEVNTLFLAAFLLLVGYWSYLTFLAFNRISENSEKEAYKNTSHLKIAQISSYENLAVTFAPLAFVFIGVLVLAMFGGIASFGFISFITIGILIGIYANLFTIPFAWGYINDKTKSKFVRKKQVKDSKEEVLQV